MEIGESLAAAIEAMVIASDTADRMANDRQAARRAIEAASLVVALAKAEGLGSR